MKKLFPLLFVLTLCACNMTIPESPAESYSHLEYPAFTTQEDTIEYTGFTSSYNHTTLLPNWVAYELTRDEVNGQCHPENASFSMDLSRKGSQAMREDYSRSGWDKGHLAPKADLRWSDQAYTESFYFTNVCPQNHDFNSGDWELLERRVRGWAKHFGSVYVVCGPVIGSNKYGTVGKNKVVIPDQFFKALLVPTDKGYSAIAFLFDNDPECHPLKDYALSVNNLESLLQRDLFPSLDDSIEESIEDSIDWKIWRL